MEIIYFFFFIWLEGLSHTKYYLTQDITVHAQKYFKEIYYFFLKKKKIKATIIKKSSFH